MKKESSITLGTNHTRSSNLNVKSMNRAFMFAIAAAFALSTSAAFAQSAAAREDQAQMKADEHALSLEKAQVEAAQSKLKADTKSGRMAAESPDAEKVYQDKQNVQGEKKDIARDKARLNKDEHK